MQSLSLERLITFCDGVVAIAITLLALNLHIERTIAVGHLSFDDLLALWPVMLAFVLSFYIIALFWLNHHMFFKYVVKVDERLIWLNVSWLFMIVMLPFTASLVSLYFTDHAAMFAYSFNTLGIAIFQNWICDYAIDREGMMKNEMSPRLKREFQVYSNVAMINGVIAVALSFVWTPAAFIVLFLRPAMKWCWDKVSPAVQ